MTYAAWALFAAAALTDWHAVFHGHKRLETFAKPATLLALNLVAVSLSATDTTAGGWLLFALAFGLLGDVMLLSDTVARFQAGLAVFLVGHLGYLLCFSELGLPRPGWSWAVFAVLLGTVVLTRDVTPSTYRSGGIALAGPVVLYTLVIATMLVMAWFTGAWVIALGATVFVASDSILSINRFVRPLPQAPLAIMVTYHLGQALIVAGVLGWS
jgi:uncharacterized membrane protein YhhN